MNKFNNCTNNVLNKKTYLTGREFTVGVMPNALGNHFEASEPIEIVPFPERDIYIAGQSFGSTQRLVKPEVEPEIASKLKEIALKAHRMLHLEYYSRCDFRYHNGTCYLLDVNTMPNMHPRLSMYPAMLQESGIAMSEFMARVLRRFRLLEYGKTMADELVMHELQKN
jgi:D-alanine-D-alanine ligase